jgi:hypothetical protein
LTTLAFQSSSKDWRLLIGNICIYDMVTYLKF